MKPRAGEHKKSVLSRLSTRRYAFYVSIYRYVPEAGKNWPEAYNYHPFIISILLLYFFYTSLPALNINSLSILQPFDFAQDKPAQGKPAQHR
jgi:hypothetical protein